MVPSRSARVRWRRCEESLVHRWGEGEEMKESSQHQVRRPHLSLAPALTASLWRVSTGSGSSKVLQEYCIEVWQRDQPETEEEVLVDIPSDIVSVHVGHSNVEHIQVGVVVVVVII